MLCLYITHGAILQNGNLFLICVTSFHLVSCLEVYIYLNLHIITMVLQVSILTLYLVLGTLFQLTKITNYSFGLFLKDNGNINYPANIQVKITTWTTKFQVWNYSRNSQIDPKNFLPNSWILLNHVFMVQIIIGHILIGYTRVTKFQSLLCLSKLLLSMVKILSNHCFKMHLFQNS